MSSTAANPLYSLVKRLAVMTDVGTITKPSDSLRPSDGEEWNDEFQHTTDPPIAIRPQDG
jgi:hypothetical protein